MTAPPSPAFSEISISFFCSDEGSDGNPDSDYCSPELKRAKRHDSAQASPNRVEGTLKKFPKSNFVSGIRDSESRLSFRSVRDSKSCHGIEHNQSSNHSLPTLDFNEPTRSHSTQFDRRSSLDENFLGDRVATRDNSEELERRSSLNENVIGGDEEAVELENDRKTRVVSSYYIHLKENQQSLKSDQSSHKPDLTGSTQPSHLTDNLECSNEASNVFDGFGMGNDSANEPVKMKFGLSEITYESGEDRMRTVLMPTQLETLLGSTQHYENWSTTNSFLEDDAPQKRLKSNEITEPPSEGAETSRTPVGNAGDSQTWNSHVEKVYKNELEFSMLVTLAYVRVRDLTNTISKAYSYLETVDKQDGEELKETNELRSEIQAMFAERAKVALEHSKWRAEFSELYQQRKKVLSNLKSQSALAEQSYFKLRKELEDLQNEPVVTKPKRGWFSRLCAFIK